MTKSEKAEVIACVDRKQAELLKIELARRAAAAEAMAMTPAQRLKNRRMEDAAIAGELQQEITAEVDGIMANRSCSLSEAFGILRRENPELVENCARYVARM